MKKETRTGTVVFEEGKYFLEVEGRREELLAGLVADEEQLRKLVGEEVEVLYSEPKRFVVGLVSRKIGPILCYVWPPWPVCYYPVPWILRGVEKEVRVNLAKRFLKEGLISEEVYDKLI